MISTQLKKLTPLIPILALLLTASAKAASESPTSNVVKNAPKSLTIHPTGSVPLKLYVLDCGRIIARDVSVFFSPGVDKGKEKELADSCYLIKHPTKGTLFWDTGLSDSLNEMKKGMEDDGFNFAMPKTVKSQIKSIGIKPSEITYLAFSHLHPDHTGNAQYFSKSTWLVQTVDYEVAFTKEAEKQGYMPADYNHLKKGPVVKLNGDHDVFGDGSVVIVLTPGHTAGHQSLFVDLPKTGPTVLAGDLYHFKKNRENYVIPTYNAKKETVHSFVKIDNLLEQTKATLWLQHDKQQFDTLKHAPQFYE
ncbi:MAG: N-acyl homoserine lactonase family protein [Cocleimonas sp.]|nr:N-acyl homoserine lactonase family protein [Cocleimonas sp.]